MYNLIRYYLSLLRNNLQKRKILLRAIIYYLWNLFTSAIYRITQLYDFSTDETISNANARRKSMKKPTHDKLQKTAYNISRLKLKRIINRLIPVNTVFLNAYNHPHIYQFP